MGQKISRATLLEAAEPFSNLSRKSVLNIWQVCLSLHIISLIYTFNAYICLTLYHTHIRSYINLAQAFNDIADGFGLSQDEFEEISSNLTDELNVTRLAMVGADTYI